MRSHLSLVQDSVLGFQKLDYNMTTHAPLCVYPTWNWASLTCQLIFFTKLEKFLSISSNIFFSFLSPLLRFLLHVSSHARSNHRRFCSFSSIFFSLFFRLDDSSLCHFKYDVWVNIVNFHISYCNFNWTVSIWFFLKFLF